MLIFVFMLPESIKVLWGAVKDAFLCPPNKTFMNDVKAICNPILEKTNFLLFFRYYEDRTSFMDCSIFSNWNELSECTGLVWRIESCQWKSTGTISGMYLWIDFSTLIKNFNNYLDTTSLTFLFISSNVNIPISSNIFALTGMYVICLVYILTIINHCLLD